MCGIIGVFNYGDNKKPANEKTLEIFQDQRNRGTQGFGLVFIDEKEKFIVKRTTNEIKMIIDANINQSRMILLHHRQPTSSKNKIQQTHPILIEHKKLKHKYLVMHNGIIKNHKELKVKHEKEGYKYNTEESEEYNDSESIAIEIAKVIEKQSKSIKAFGSCAFLAIQYDTKTEKVTEIYYGRNEESQLKMAKSRDLIRISSEAKGELIKANTLYHFNLQDFTIKKQNLTFDIEQKEIGFKSIYDNGIYLGNRQSNLETTPKTLNNYNQDYDYDTPETEWDLEQKLEESTEIINEELSEIQKKMTDETNFWDINIDNEIKTVIGTTIIELKNNYEIAKKFYTNKIIKESEQDMDKKLDKIAEKQTTILQDKLYSR